MLLGVSKRDSFKTAEQHRVLARAYVAGVPLTRALVLAGYSPSQARKGWAIVNRSKGLREAIAEHGKLLAELGGNITVQQQENLVRGRLVLNTIRGTDKGTRSAKTLGSEKRVSMWQRDTQRSLVILNSPTGELGNREHLLGTDESEDSTIHDERNRNRELLGFTGTPAKA
jgi:hypothetical protein